MAFVEDARKIAAYSFTWLKGGYWKLYAVFAAIYFVLNLFDTTGLSTSGPAGIALAAFVGLVLIVVYLFLIYFGYKALYLAMSDKFPKLRKFDLEMVVKLFLSNILMILAAMFSAFELKWLALPVVAGLLGIAGFALGVTSGASLALFAIAALLAFAYFVIVMRNMARLYLQSGFFLQGAGIIGSNKQAWSKSSGKALRLFGLMLVVGIIAMIITVVELIPQLLVGFLDAAINVAGIPLRPFSAVFAAAFGPAVVMIQYFAFVATFEWLLKQQGKASAPSEEKKIGRAPVKKTKR